MVETLGGPNDLQKAEAFIITSATDPSYRRRARPVNGKPPLTRYRRIIITDSEPGMNKQLLAENGLQSMKIYEKISKAVQMESIILFYLMISYHNVISRNIKDFC